MNKPKLILTIASSVVLLSVLVPMLMGQPLMLDLSSDTIKAGAIKYHKGDIVNPVVIKLNYLKECPKDKD
jgi:NhaP-type Na+/H+ or K+/H+ antiporter